jgi:hypothetical protein
VYNVLTVLKYLGIACFALVALEIFNPLIMNCTELARACDLNLIHEALLTAWIRLRIQFLFVVCAAFFVIRHLNQVSEDLNKLTGVWKQHEEINKLNTKWLEVNIRAFDELKNLTTSEK